MNPIPQASGAPARLALTLPQLDMVRRYAKSRFVHRFRDRSGFEAAHQDVPGAAWLLDLADLVLAAVREVESFRERRRKARRAGRTNKRSPATKCGFAGVGIVRYEASPDGQTWTEIANPTAEDARK